MKRDLLVVVIVAICAYAGGYFYGRFPKSDRELSNSKSLVILSTQPELLPPELQSWLEVHWGHSLIVRAFPSAEMAAHLGEADLVLGTKASLDPIRPQLINRPSRFNLTTIDPDFLRHGSQSVPVLWKLSPMAEGGFHLLLLEVAWTPKKNQQGEIFVTWLLSRDFQELWARTLQMRPVNRQLLERGDPQDIKDLRSIPLDKLRYD